MSSTRLRQYRWHLGAAFAAMLVLASCGATAASDTAGPDTEFTAAVLTVGNRSDSSFGQALAESADKVAAGGGVRVEFVGNLASPDQYLAQGSSFAQSGFDFVLLGHGAMGPIAVTLAQRFPETTFCVPSLPFGQGTENPPPNACFFYPRAELGAFRAGVLAGLATRSNVVASNQSLVFPALTVQAEAFRLGAQCVNSAVRVLNAVTNNDFDPSPTKTASEAQIGEGADVLFGATGTAISGMFQAASERAGVYAIGQYVDASAAAPQAVIASSIVNLQDIVPFVIEQARTGTLPQVQTLGLGLPVQVGYLMPNDELVGSLPEQVWTAYEHVDQRITSGEIEVPALEQLGQPNSSKDVRLAELGCTDIR